MNHLNDGFWIQVTSFLFFIAYIALLNILSVLHPVGTKRDYSGWTIFLIIFASMIAFLSLERFLPMVELEDSLVDFMLAIMTITFVFFHEKTLKTIGLSLNGVGKSLLIGSVAGIMTCIFWGNINFFGDGTGISDISAGQIIIMAPLSEEVFFRGFLIRYFRTKEYSPFKSIIYSSFIWTLFHFYGFQASSILFMSGCLMGCVRVKTKSLAGPIAMHFIWNFMAI